MYVFVLPNPRSQSSGVFYFMNTDIKIVTIEEYRKIWAENKPAQKNIHFVPVTINTLDGKKLMISIADKLITPFDYYLGKR